MSTMLLDENVCLFLEFPEIKWGWEISYVPTPSLKCPISDPTNVKYFLQPVKTLGI